MYIFGSFLDSSEEYDNYYADNFQKEAIIESAPVINDDFSDVAELHWDHLPIKYFIRNEKECGTYETAQINRAFIEISVSTNNTVYFEKVNNSMESDIELFCSFIEDCYNLEKWEDAYWEYEEETICAHDLGRALITETKGNKIIKAEIELIGLEGFSETSNRRRSKASGFYIGTCGDANTEIHEILHVFGFDHSFDWSSIMYPRDTRESGYKVSNNNCAEVIVEIDDEYSSCLKYIYSNGLSGTCSEIENYYIETEGAPLISYCEDGYYEATNDINSCCPEPGMWADEYYCNYP